MQVSGCWKSQSTGSLWGAALQEDDYLQTATMYYDKLNSWKADNYAYDWDNKSPALHVLLTQIFPSEMMKWVSTH